MIPTLLFGAHLATAALAAQPLSLRIRDAVAEHPPSLDVVTDNYAVFTWSDQKSRSSEYLRLLRRDFSSSDKPTATATANELSYAVGKEMVVNVTFEGTDISLIVDTGSSDLWVPQVNYTCVDEEAAKPVPDSTCNFGSYRFSTTPSGGWKQDVHLHSQMSDGNTTAVAVGRYALVDVALGGLKVSKQQVGIVNFTSVRGDGVTVGRVGLGYPFATAAYTGGNVNADNLTNHVPYDGIMTSIMKNNKAITSFSIALPRGSSSGFLAFGGVPPVPFEDKFASLPIQTLDALSPTVPELKGQYAYYIIPVDGFVFDGAPAAKKASYVVDTGTSHNYVPTDVFNALIKAYKPAATKVDGKEGAFAPCDATPPAFGVTIAGQTFQMSKDTMFEGNPVDVKGTKMCALSTRDGGADGFVLGHAFLKNVVTVYDIGAAQLRFASLK